VANRLAHESSPYLLQHANNPVDWYPWGEEALALARRKDRPILVSIGYSACHWCHVMERESFEDPDVAQLMNDNFVSIKVDREERPDVDSIYMAAVQQMSGSGGWPLNAFLTPDLKPFFGGTYFPPQPRYGMPSWRSVLERVARAFRERREEVEHSADKVAQAIANDMSGPVVRSLPRGLLDDAAAQLKRNFDIQHGGFGRAPKFPQAMSLEFCLRSWKRTGDVELLEHVKRSLVAMAHGGIYDQLGGGFHRYSTDEHWLVPHFEKMLYDQALLAPLYLHTFQATGENGYRTGCTRTIDYVLGRMTSPEGGFYCAEDADSEGVEGSFYTWTPDEVRAVVGSDYELVAQTFGITADGNWEGRNILHIAGDRNSVPQRLGLGLEEYRDRLREAKARLLAAREERVHPDRDDKVLGAWSGLMLSAVAEAAAVLQRSDYLEAAQTCARFMLDHMCSGISSPSVGSGVKVSRSYRAGRAKGDGFLEDYTALAGGLLDLYQADFNPRWYEAAVLLGEAIMDRFSGDGIFYSTVADHGLLHRPRDFDDNALPSGNSMAAEVLLKLALFSGEDRFREAAVAAMEALSEAMRVQPLFFGRLLSAVDMQLGDPLEIAVVGDGASPQVQELLAEARRQYGPNKVLAQGPEGRTSPPLLEGRLMLGRDGTRRAAAYLCRGFVCEQPVDTPDALRQQLSLTSL